MEVHSLSHRDYCMVIGDIVESKKIPHEEREKIQRNLKMTLEKINFDYDKSICSNFCITLGDELQGGLINTLYLFKIIERIKESISPYKMRFGIGIGEISTDINFNLSLSADGPAYHAARKGIDELKKEKTYEYGCRIYTTNNDMLILNSLIKSIDNISSSWTARQKEYINVVMNSSGDLTKISQYLNIAKSTLSRTLLRANFKFIKEALENIELYLCNEYDLSSGQEPNAVSYNKACIECDKNNIMAAINLLQNLNFEDRIDESNRLLLLSSCLIKINNDNDAIECAQKALEQIRVGFLYKRVKLYNIIGIAYSDLNELINAKNSFDAALDLIDKDPNPASIIWRYYTSDNIAGLYKKSGNNNAAKKIYDDMLETLNKFYENDKLTQVKILSNLIDIYIAECEYKKAYSVVSEALKIAEIYLLKDSETSAILKLHFGEIIVDLSSEKTYNIENDQVKAYEMLNEAAQVFSIHNNTKGQCECYATLVRLCEVIGDKINLKRYEKLLNGQGEI